MSGWGNFECLTGSRPACRGNKLHEHDKFTVNLLYGDWQSLNPGRLVSNVPENSVTIRPSLHQMNIHFNKLFIHLQGLSTPMFFFFKGKMSIYSWKIINKFWAIFLSKFTEVGPYIKSINTNSTKLSLLT